MRVPRLCAFVFVVLSLAASVSAQQQDGTRVQQSATDLRACTPISATAAVNTVTTLTIPAPNATQYTYIYEIDMSISNDATGAVTQANVAWTSTNLNGWQVKYSSTNALNTSTQFGPFVYQTGMQSITPGVAVTIVSPAINLHALYTISACYKNAP